MLQVALPKAPRLALSLVSPQRSARKHPLPQAGKWKRPSSPGHSQPGTPILRVPLRASPSTTRTLERCLGGGWLRRPVTRQRLHEGWLEQPVRPCLQRTWRSVSLQGHHQQAHRHPTPHCRGSQ